MKTKYKPRLVAYVSVGNVVALALDMTAGDLLDREVALGMGE
jgi:hypothetical protein